MTKAIRVENACTSDFRVVVQVWDRGGMVNGVPQHDRLVQEILLGHPTAMTPQDLYITDTRYLIVKEAPPK